MPTTEELGEAGRSSTRRRRGVGSQEELLQVDDRRGNRVAGEVAPWVGRLCLAPGLPALFTEAGGIPADFRTQDARACRAFVLHDVRRSCHGGGAENALVQAPEGSPCHGNRRRQGHPKGIPRPCPDRARDRFLSTPALGSAGPTMARLPWARSNQTPSCRKARKTDRACLGLGPAHGRRTQNPEPRQQIPLPQRTWSIPLQSNSRW